MRIAFVTHLVMPVFLAAALLIGMGTTWGQGYPVKPIRIVTAAPGGGADFAARLIAQELTPALGQQVIVDNRGGGSGVIAAETVARALPDGYTLLLFSSSMWTLPFMQKTPYDPVRDFAPVTLAVKSPNILVVHPSLPVTSVTDLIALAKASPGVLNYGAGTTGSSSHLGPELFKSMTGVNIVRVPYKGAGPALTALVAGEVQMMIASAGSVAMTHVRAGKLKAIASTGAQPSSLLPGLPTVSAAVSGFEIETTTGIFAPAKTPAPIINKLNQEIARVLNHAEMKEKFFKTAVDVVGSSPHELAAKVKADMARLGKVIKDAGIKSDL